MKWATRILIHFDRVASAWLILRFIDAQAEFIFLEEGQSPPDDVTPFALPGARLAVHGGGATTFQRILEAHSLDDPALAVMSHIASAIVGHVTEDPTRDSLATRDPHVTGVLAIAEGIMLLSATDDECLMRSLPLYDALHARLRAAIELERLVPSPPASIFEQTVQFAKATGALRNSNVPFTGDAFAKALRALRTT